MVEIIVILAMVGAFGFVAYKILKKSKTTPPSVGSSGGGSTGGGSGGGGSTIDGEDGHVRYPERQQ